jgi:pyridoxal phosphate enzyme (YggS family)
MNGAPVDAARVAERVQAVRERIAAAGGVGVALLAVTKTFPVEAILAAVGAGCDGIGENYAQELVAKLAALPTLLDGAPRPEVHFIGQLQSNKVRALAGLVDVFETIDRPSLAAELAKRCPGARVLVQVGVTGEPGKGGVPVDEVVGLVEQCGAVGLCVDGLMTVGRTIGGPEASRSVFRTVRGLVDSLGLQVCSMGMSDDLEVAVQEGATLVRVGSALFGSRPPQA